MDKIKRFLWHYLGITLDKEFYIVLAVFLASCLLSIVFFILFQNTQSTTFKVLMYLVAIPAGILVVGGIFNTL